MSDRKRLAILFTILTTIWSILAFTVGFIMTKSPLNAFFVMLLALIPALLIWGFQLATLNALNRRAFKGKSKDGNTSPRQSKIVEVDMPYQQTFDLCLEGIKTITGSKLKVMGMTNTIKARVKEADSSSGHIIGKTRTWLWFIPDIYEEMRITLKVEQITPTVTRIHIDNRPVLPSVVFDWGYGLHNVNKIALYLREEAHLHNAESHLRESSADDIIVALEKQQQLESES